MVLRLTPKPEFFNSPSQVAAFVANARVIGVDTETVGADGTPEGALDVHSNRITVWSIATEDRRAACSRYALEGLKEGLRMNKHVKVVIHNFSFDGPVLRRSGVNLPDLVSSDRLIDTLILDNLLNPDGVHDLKFLSKTRLKISYQKYKAYGFDDDDYGDQEKGIPPSERFSDYASLDAWCTVMLYHHLVSQLSNRLIYDGAPLVFGNRLESLRDYYEVIEQPLMAILHQMTTTGVRIDVPYLKAIEPVLEEQLARTHADLCNKAGIIFNPSSADQVRTLLYDDLGYPVQNVKSRKTGELSVNEKVLKALMALPPPEPQYAELPMGIALYRQRRLLKTTFVTGLINKLVKDRLHSVFNQHRTATGRLSCVSGATLVHTTRGSFRFDEYIPHVGDKTRSHTGALRPIIRKVYKGVDKMFRVCLSNGAAIECTADHSVLTPSGWTRVGELTTGDSVRTYDVSVETLYARPGECEAGLRGLPIRRQTDSAGNSEAYLHDVPQCPLCGKHALVKREVEGGAGFEVFPVQNGCCQPYAGEDMEGTPQLEGGVRRRLRVPDLPGEQEESIRSPGGICGDAGDRGRESLPGTSGSPHQLGPKGQQARQSGDGHEQRPSTHPHEGETGTVVEITPLGAMGVWTIEVAEDHSYATHGFYSKNSSAPNLQNIPKSSDPSIRRAFIPSAGYRFIDADYAQIELRVLAHLSQATTMLDPILQGIDIHSLTAASLADTTYAEVMEAVAASKLHGVEMSERHKYLIRMRAIAKTVNFGIPYGISAQGILVNLQVKAGIRITLQECQQYLDKYWEDHPDVWEYNLGLIRSVRDSGIVHTYLGRQRPISGLRGKRANSHSINQTYNTPIQGSAGDLLKIAMLNMYRDQRFQDLGLRMVLQVHDELVIETPEENDAEGLELVQELMPQHLVPFSVPLDIDAQLGDNWGDLH